MNEHLTEDDFTQLRNGEWQADRTLVAMRHLDQCAKCAAIARSTRDLEGEARHLVQTLSPLSSSREHLDPETTLPAFIDGTLTPDERAAVETHLAVCEICAVDAADLRDAQRHVSVRPFRWLAVAASIAIAVLVAAWFSAGEDPQPPQVPQPRVAARPVIATPPPSRARPEWDQLVSAAVTRGSVEVSPDVPALRGSRDTFRGNEPAAPAMRIEPAGEVVMTARPRFTWPAAARGSVYVVSVVATDREIARSPRIAATEWRPRADLPSGQVLTWQVTVEGDGGAMHIIPAPPDPPARFRILGPEQRGEIDAARRLHPDDHLLLGLLLARYGVVTAAESELTAHAAQHPQDASAQRLLENLREKEKAR